MIDEIDNETDYLYYKEIQHRKFLQKEYLYYDDNYEPEVEQEEPLDYIDEDVVIFDLTNFVKTEKKQEKEEEEPLPF